MNDIKNQVQIVLVETSHPGNIGSVARAMKTMGLQNLVLVKPRNFPSKEAFVLSGNAQDLIEQAVVVDTLDEAIKNCTNIYATSARTRSISWPIITAEMAGIEINKFVREGTKTSIIFGREDRGLTNEELQIANTHIEIPANPEYPVLNIAMSAQIICYEILKASIDTTARDWHDYPEVDSENLQMLIDHFIETATDIDVINPDNPKKIISRIKRMFTRLHPDEMETSFLRGFLSGIKKKIK